jgi:mono/diheme cytochrome c family protein
MSNRNFMTVSRSMRQQLSLFVVAVFALTGLASCRQDMHDQPKYEAYEGSDFFADSAANRVAVDGTVPRGFLNEDESLYGTPAMKAGDSSKAKTYLASFPYPVSAKMLDRGEERFNIYCAPCHGRTGMGDGMVVRRGYRKPPTFHQERLRTQPVGYFFDVITNGFGVMPSYMDQIPVRDRWAIVSYIRALQLSQNANIADVPADQRAMIDGGAAAPNPSVNPVGQHSISEPTGGTSPSSGSASESNSHTQSGGHGK